MSASLGLRSDGIQVAGVGSILLLTLMATGCTSSPEATSQIDLREPPRTAQAVLERVVEAYHKADRYQDHGRLLVHYIHDGETADETSEFSLAVAAPNRIRMRAYNALVVCDGQTLCAKIDDAPGEVLSVAAPDELSPASIYRDPVLSKSLNQIVGSVPVWLFLDPEPLPELLLNGQTPQLDTPDSIGPNRCYRVRIERREGASVYWIDEKTFVVRRIECPAGGYRRLIEPFVGEIADMTITAEFTDARLDPTIDESTFQIDLPKDADLVKRFDLVRPGARVPRFELRGLDGQEITRDSLAGKIAVLKFWQKDDVFRYYKDLSGFEQLKKRYQNQDSLVFLSVSADPSEVSDETLKATFDKAELALPIARVARKVAVRSFGLPIVPATVILGKDGTLQDHMVGVYPNQVAALGKKIDTLLAGADLTLEAPEELPQYLFYSGFDWQNAQKSAQEQPATVAAALVKAGVAPASEPQSLKRKRVWTCSELRQPGNILVAHDEPGRDRAWVVEGLPCVAEIGAGGKVLARHRLDLPDRDDAEVTFLRTATDKAGDRYFLGSRAGAQQLHLFDANWKRLLSFPEAGDHPGISDALFADLNGDGKLKMYVGYLQSVGVHCVGLDGERLWRNRVAENVFRLAVTGPDRQGERQLLVADGAVLPIDAAGRERPPLSLSGAIVRLIYAADLDGDDRYEWCAIAMAWAEPGQPVHNMAIGLSPSGQELWRYTLPEGTHQHVPFEMVATGALFEGYEGQWIIAAPDGSIHILGGDGGLIDRFNYGASPSGMAIAKLDDQPALLISTDEGTEAWQFELPPAAEQASKP